MAIGFVIGIAMKILGIGSDVSTWWLLFPAALVLGAERVRRSIPGFRPKDSSR